MTVFITGLLLLTATGCASFRDGANPPIATWPPKSGGKPTTINLQVSAQSLVNGKQKEVHVDQVEAWRTPIIRGYESAGLFTTIKSGGDSADIYADVKIVYKSDGSMVLVALSAVTGLMIPFKAQDCFTMKTTYKDRTGTVLGLVEKSECADVWVQVFLFPVMFTHFPTSVWDEILLDLTRNTILEVRTKGAL